MRASCAHHARIMRASGLASCAHSHRINAFSGQQRYGSKNGNYGYQK
jgi:hypothetical protein